MFGGQSCQVHHDTVDPAVWSANERRWEGVEEPVFRAGSLLLLAMLVGISEAKGDPGAAIRSCSRRADWVHGRVHGA